MSVPVKAVQTVPYAIAEIAAGVAQAQSSILDVSEFFSAAVFWDFAPAAATGSAFATILQILGSNKLISGTVDDEDDAWSLLQDWLSPTAQATEFTSVAGTAGANTLTIASGSPAVYADHHIEGSAVSEAQSEWVHVIGLSGTTVTIRGVLKNTYSGATMRSGALKQRFDLDLSNVGKLKFVLGNNRGGTERDVINRIRMIALESVSGT